MLTSSSYSFGKRMSWFYFVRLQIVKMDNAFLFDYKSTYLLNLSYVHTVWHYWHSSSFMRENIYRSSTEKVLHISRLKHIMLVQQAQYKYGIIFNCHTRIICTFSTVSYKAFRKKRKHTFPILRVPEMYFIIFALPAMILALLSLMLKVNSHLSYRWDGKGKLINLSAIECFFFRENSVCWSCWIFHLSGKCESHVKVQVKK